MKTFFLLASLFALTELNDVTLAYTDKKCYFCTGVEGVNNGCNGANFDPSKDSVQTIDCPNNKLCYIGI